MNLELTESQIIANRGWRQGSIFDPREINLEVISVSGQPLTENELLIVCTQSCSIVEQDFSKEPLVEAIAVTMLEEYNPKSEIATGKTVRRLHVGIPKHPVYKGVECNLINRFFIDRKKLAQMHPLKEFQIDVSDVTKLSGWITRYYNRIALPDELVISMKKKLTKLFKKTFEKKLPLTKSPIYESIASIYINWVPREYDGSIFSLYLFFICTDTDSAQHLDELLQDALEPYCEGEGKDGIKIINLRCHAPEEVFLSELTGYERYTEWDNLSEFGELINAPLLSATSSSL